MSTDGLKLEASRIRKPDIYAALAVALFAYYLLTFDLPSLEAQPAWFVTNAVLSAGVVIVYLKRCPTRADSLDQACLGALILFGFVAVFSQVPRQSLQAVLGTLLAVAGLFVARDVLSRPAARRIFMTGLMACSAVLTGFSAAYWFPSVGEWWALTDWRVLPPLDLAIMVQPWGLRHEMALMLVLLYPSWWTGNVRPVRAVIAIVIGVLTVGILVVDGSRTIWVAALVGLASIAFLRIHARFHVDRRRAALLVVGAVALMTVALLLSGTGGVLLERAARLAPLSERGSLWSALWTSWAASPIVGHGPGSFAWLLQPTGYFDTHSFTPRHADSAPIQLLAEAGVVGVAAVLAVLARAVPAVQRGRSKAAIFALTTFLVASFTLNPTTLVCLVAVTIGWVAYAAPHARQGPAPNRKGWSNPAGAVAIGLSSILAVAFTATVVAHVAYAGGRYSVDHGDLDAAGGNLALAASLDPGLSIYARQLGTLRLIQGQKAAAATELRRATRLNPGDDLAWRVLSLALTADGDQPGSRVALEQAVVTQRSDPTNLLLLAREQLMEGDTEAAKNLLAEVVQAWPSIIAAPGWTEFVEAVPSAKIVGQALSRWHEGLPSPEPRGSQPILLSVMAGMGTTSVRGQSGLSDTLEPALVAVMSCDPAAADALHAVSDSDRRTATYWALVLRLAAIEGRPTNDYERLFSIMTGRLLKVPPEEDQLNALDENGNRETSADERGYGRLPIAWPTSAWLVPSPRSGFAQWYLQPRAAIATAGLDDLNAACDRIAQASASWWAQSTPVPASGLNP